MTRARTAAVIAAAVGTCALSLSAAGPVAAVAQGDGDRAAMSVFHGVPGLTADIYANGKELLSDAKPGMLTAPRSLDAGTYDITVFKAGADPDSKPLIEKKVDVSAGSNATVVAHLSAEGSPRLDAYTNDVSRVPADRSRLTVRHVAAAPAVNVRVDGKTVIKGLENPREAKAEVPAGTATADVVRAGTSDVVIGPADLNLKEGTSNIVYAWGSADDKNLALKVQPLSGRQTPPEESSTGAGGASGPTTGGESPGAMTAWGAVGLAGPLIARRRAARAGG